MNDEIFEEQVEDLKKRGFWKRQFNNDVTKRQIIFDLVFGFVLPVICIMFDPFIFKSSDLGIGEGILNEYKIFAYIFIGLEILMLLTWLFTMKRLKISCSLFSGILLAGGICSFAIGIVLVPLSIFGIFVSPIGILGFSPLFTAFVFMRNAIRSMKAANKFMKKKGLVFTIILTMAVVITISALANWTLSFAISQLYENTMSTDVVVRKDSVNKLKILKCFTNSYDMVRLHQDEDDMTRRKYIGKAYGEIFNEDIELAEEKLLMND